MYNQLLAMAFGLDALPKIFKESHGNNMQSSHGVGDSDLHVLGRLAHKEPESGDSRKSKMMLQLMKRLRGKESDGWEGKRSENVERSYSKLC